MYIDLNASLNVTKFKVFTLEHFHVQLRYTRHKMIRFFRIFMKCSAYISEKENNGRENIVVSILIRFFLNISFLVISSNRSAEVCYDE